MKYFVDIHNTSNTASLQNFLQSKIDLCNNFFPGIDKQIGGKIADVLHEGAVHARREHGVARPEHDEGAAERSGVPPRARHVDQHQPDRRRRTTATSSSKANPTGLLPIWNKWVDKPQAEKLGFSYNVDGAKALLAANGYKDTDGDGFVENKDGSDINLRIIVPNGWSDWMTAIQIIADSTKDAGIKLTPAYPDFNGLVDERELGQVRPRDQQREADRQHAVHLLRLPLPPADRGDQTTVNFARFNQAGAAPWALTLQAEQDCKSSNVVAAKKIHSQLQTVILEHLPAIPLWYNGMWAQYNTSVWTNFPQAAGTGLQTRRRRGTAT